ncbi:Probable septum site-determining protein minC [hydrothermal vent metagenome]|uniref:Probable septum site-determining protein minC n=1 Tax=hydrothermal vent metagenome TaxID=652676 RepID=A0A1W1BLC7_9ZZZZ
MKNKQYSVKVFECSVEDEAEFISFFDANYTLFKDHLILINGDISVNIKEYLESKSLIFLQNTTLPKGRTRKALEDEINAVNRERDIDKLVAESKIATLSNKLQNNLTVLDDMIRSGRELNIDGDLLLLNRVNSGATVSTKGNLIITQLVEGAIRCDGNFMMLTSSSKANVIFNGVEVDNKFLKDKLNRVELKNSEIVITPVFRKEINWV